MAHLIESSIHREARHIGNKYKTLRLLWLESIHFAPPLPIPLDHFGSRPLGLLLAILFVCTDIHYFVQSVVP